MSRTLRLVLAGVGLLAPAAVAVLLMLHFAGEPPADADDQAALGAPVAETAEPTREALASGDAADSPDPDPQASVASAPDDAVPIVWVKRGHSVAVRDAPAGKVVAEQDDETRFGSPNVFAVRRQRPRWLGVTTPAMPNGEIGWIPDDTRRLRGAYVTYAIEIDLSERSARLLLTTRSSAAGP